jgi:hypothetical protein
MMIRRGGTLATTLLLFAGLTACSATPGAGTATDADKADAATVTVTISGGHETDPLDNGRPVVLIAAALGVPTDVFREAFSGVSPAGAGQNVDSERATANKAALLSVLGSYGVTNDELDTVSNFYRYVASDGELWSHRDATAVAVVEDGVVTGFVITDPGFGYSSPPTITLSTGATRIAGVSYGLDLATNGSLANITLAAG